MQDHREILENYKAGRRTQEFLVERYILILNSYEAMKNLKNISGVGKKEREVPL